MAQIIAVKPLFERIAAKEKKFNDVIVFVHQYGGHKHSFKRHIEWVNELGFDAITFDLPLSEVSELGPRSLPLDRNFNFGLRYAWADKIEQVLGAISEKKIIYSFSSPSSAGLMAIARRQAVDIQAWVCDGGPFIDIEGGIDNYLREFNTHNLNRFTEIRKLYSKAIAWLIGVKNYDAEMALALSQLPPQFAICNIRSESDPLVSIQMIDRFFELHAGSYQLYKLTLSKSGHLAGLREEPTDYKNKVGEFLSSYSNASSP